MIKRKRSRVYLLLIPACVLYACLFLYPVIQAFFVSFHDWSGFTVQMRYIGLDNYRELIEDQLYHETMIITLKVVFLGGAGIFFLALFFTFILTSGIKAKKVFRSIIFLPNVIAPIALSTFWGFVYNPRFGLINGMLRSVGLGHWEQIWMGPDLVFWSVLIALIWTYVGFYMVILLSGVEKIPADLYEVARIEGSNRLQIFFKVTIPLIWDIVVVCVVLWIINSIKLFEFLFAFSGGTRVPRGIWTNAVYMFMLTFGKRTAIFRLGYGTTVAVSLLLLIIVLTGLARLLMRKEKIEY